MYLDALLSGLTEAAEVTLLSFCSLEEAERDPCMRPGLAAVHRIPHPLRRELQGAKRLVHQLHMLRLWGLGGLPLDVAKFSSKTMRRMLPEVAVRSKADLAVFEFRQMAQYLPCLPELPRVFCDHEAGDPKPVEFGPERDARLTAAYVRKYYPMADLILALNDTDAASLSRRLGQNVELRPATVTIPQAQVQPSTAPPIALFLGDYRHHPNPEAAVFLAREVWPLVQRELPEAQLWLAGPNATAEVEALAGDSIRVLGFVEDLPQLLGKARCLVTPLFSGSGSRIKVLTALAHGLPCIGNELAFRGIDAGDTVRRGETAEQIATETLELLSSAENAAELGQQGRTWAEKNLDPRALARQQVARYTELIEQLRN